MEDMPAAVIEKAKRLEELLQRIAEGEALEQVSAELDLTVDAKRVAQLQAKYEAEGGTWEALIDGRYGHPIKAHSALKAWLYERKRQDKALTAADLVAAVKEQFEVALSVGHINYLLRKVELSRPPGRPPTPTAPATEATPEAPEAAQQALDNAGIFFPGSWEAGDGHPAGGGDEPGDRPPGLSGGESHSVAAGGSE